MTPAVGPKAESAISTEPHTSMKVLLRALSIRERQPRRFDVKARELTVVATGLDYPSQERRMLERTNRNKHDSHE